jgi:hypothetical protein
MMKASVFAFVLLFAAASSQAAIDSSDVAERANAQAEKIDDVKDYVTGVNDAVELAKAGEYGKIKRRDLERLEESASQINTLLHGQQSALDLPLDERIELYNAQEAITSILRNDQKNRMVCRRVANTGTRIPTTECLTVAQREARAKGARASADKLPRPTCIPGQGAGC